jgi:hypothetical protein
MARSLLVSFAAAFATAAAMLVARARDRFLA